MDMMILFSAQQIERIARLLGSCRTGSEISDILERLGIKDSSGESTKWKRLNHVLITTQHECGHADHVLAVIKSILDPVYFTGNQSAFEEIRNALNLILAFSGLEYGSDGQFHRRQAAQTLDQAMQRQNAIQEKLRRRNMHPRVEQYCKAELLQDNYFHALLEASKGLAQHIREKSGIEKDGAALVDEAFSINSPILAFNSLQSETDKSVQKGLAALLKGCFAAIRNPLAHQPKINWEGYDDVADYLSLISLLHRKIDDCVRIK